MSTGMANSIINRTEGQTGFLLHRESVYIAPDRKVLFPGTAIKTCYNVMGINMYPWESDFIKFFTDSFFGIYFLTRKLRMLMKIAS